MSESPENVALGEAVRLLRERAQLTQDALAERSGLSRSTLRRIESGRVDATWGSLRRLAAGLGVELADLLRRADRMREDGRGSA